MNILYLFYLPVVPYVGGIQRVTETLAVEFKRRGNNVYYLSIYNAGADGYFFPVPQLTINNSAGSEEAKNEYVRLLEQFNIDVVICQEPRADLLSFLSITPKGIIRITCYHCRPFYDQSYTRKVLRYYNRYGLREFCYKTFCRLFPRYYSRQTLTYSQKMWSDAFSMSDYVCLLSSRFFDRVCRYAPFADRSKLIAFNNPNPFRALDSISDCPKEKLILWVARHINGQKNFPLFVDFWVRFKRNHPDWTAMVLGDGDDWLSNKAYASKKHSADLEFVGNQKNVSSFYHRASFIMMTSFWEGWGMVLIEAMSFGCVPCVFDTFESLHDIVDDGKNGIIIHPFKLKEAVSRLDTIASNAEAMKKMRKGCLNKVRDFEVEKIVDQWEKFLSEKCSQKNEKW